MKTILSTSFFFISLLICFMACKKEDEDYEAMRAANQEVIDQVAHIWQVSQLRISSTDGDTAFIDAGYLQFVHCKVDRDNLSGCDGGFYRFEGQEKVSFSYDVITPSPLEVAIRPENYPEYNAPILDLYGNWDIVKVTEDSLILEENSRVLRLFKE